MRICPGCSGNIHAAYCVCPSCGWLGPKARRREKELKLEIEKRNSQEPHRVKVETIRVGWGKLGNCRVLPER
jgi:hypothetical protein